VRAREFSSSSKMYMESSSHSIIIGLLVVILVLILVMAFVFIIVVLLPLSRIIPKVESVLTSVQNLQGTAEQVKKLSDTISVAIPEFKSAICGFLPSLSFCEAPPPATT